MPNQISGNFQAVHKRTSLAYRKGKIRLRPLSLKQLTEIVEKERSGKRFDAAQKEIARKHKMGLIWLAPVPEEAAE